MTFPVALRVENEPSAGVVPPTTPSNVPAFMSAVVATNEVIVPKEVNEEANTSAFNVAPVNVPAAAVTVIGALPLKSTPLIALGVVRVAAEPVVL